MTFNFIATLFLTSAKTNKKIIVDGVLSNSYTRYTAHLGYDSVLRRARDTIFWLDMPAEIKQLANNCNICQQMQLSNLPDTLLLHNEGLLQLEKISVDIFQYDRKHYLVTIDYFANFAEIDVLPSLNTSYHNFFRSDILCTMAFPSVMLQIWESNLRLMNFAYFVLNGLYHITCHHQDINKVMEKQYM